LEYDSTLKSYENALDAFPKSKGLQANVGEWLTHTGDLQGAVRHFTSRTEKYPDEHTWYAWLGVVRWRMGDLESAEKSFQAVRRIDSDASEALLSSLYQATGRFDKALEILKQSTRGREAERQDGYRLFHHYWLTGQLNESKVVLDSLWTAEVDFPDFHRFYLSARACSYQTENNAYGVEKYISSLRDFGKNYGKNIPRYKIRTKVQLANCLITADSLDLAEHHLAVADSIVDETRPALSRDSHLDYFMGRVQQEKGNYSQAARHYERFLKIHTAHDNSLIWSLGRPRLQLAIAYQKSGSVDKARGSYEDALTIYPSHPKINFRYGEFLAERGEIDQAQTHLRRALEGWAKSDSVFAPKQQAEVLLDSLGTEVI
jgi:tetratricopeptide (TPR) repeat protein